MSYEDVVKIGTSSPQLWFTNSKCVEKYQTDTRKSVRTFLKHEGRQPKGLNVYVTFSAIKPESLSNVFRCYLLACESF